MSDLPSTSHFLHEEKTSVHNEACGNHSNEVAEKRLMDRIEAENETHSHEPEDQHAYVNEALFSYSFRTNSRKVMFMIVLTFTFFLIELTVGFINRSIALLADSYHMLSDVMALCVALICLRVCFY